MQVKRNLRLNKKRSIGEGEGGEGRNKEQNLIAWHSTAPTLQKLHWFWCHYLLSNALFSGGGGPNLALLGQYANLLPLPCKLLRIAGRESPEESWQCHTLRWEASILQRTPEILLPPQICASGEVLPGRGSETESVCRRGSENNTSNYKRALKYQEMEIIIDL